MNFVDLKDAIVHAEERGSDVEVWDLIEERPATLWPPAPGVYVLTAGRTVEVKFELAAGSNREGSYGVRFVTAFDYKEGRRVPLREVIAQVEGVSRRSFV